MVQDSRFRTSSQVQSFRVVIANRLEDYPKGRLKEFEKRKSANSNGNGLPGKIKTWIRLGFDQATTEPCPPADITEQSREETTAQGETEDQDEATYQSVLQSYHSLGQLSGGPAQVINYAAPRMGAPWDNGELLVNLIQNTIDPDVWRNNSGNASFHYYRPERVMIINGSQSPHQKTQDLLWKLRVLN